MLKPTPRNNPFTNEAAEAARRATLASLGISGREVREYSLSRAIRAMIDGKSVGYESECHQELRRQGHEARHNGGILVPTGALVAKRDMTAGSASAGGYLVATQNVSFIDLLRSRLICGEMGATILNGLRDNVTIPKQTAAATANWLANEGASITESQMTLGQIAMTPKTVGAYTEVSRQLLLQSSPAADQVVADDLAKVVALAVDAAAIAGTGASGQPTGIINTAGIGSVDGASLDYAKVLEFQTDVLGASAVVNPEATGFVTTPAVAALLLQRQKVSSTYSPLWEGSVRDGQMVGARAMTTTAMPSASMIFGDWSQLVVGEWGILELATNPFADFAKGVIGIRAMQSVDIAVRHAGSFSLATSIT